MTLIFGAALAGLAWNYNRALVEALRLRFRNADLADDLLEAQRLAEAAGRSSWENLAHLSHELRKPLNAIAGFADIMPRQLFGPLGIPKYSDYSKDIAESAAHLCDLIDEILLYSKGHTGALSLDETAIDTRAEIESCLQMVVGTARAGDVTLVRRFDDELPPLRADALKFRQMLSSRICAYPRTFP